jgi:hypothetical protein
LKRKGGKELFFSSESLLCPKLKEIRVNEPKPAFSTRWVVQKERLTNDKKTKTENKYRKISL